MVFLSLPNTPLSHRMGTMITPRARIRVGRYGMLAGFSIDEKLT